MKQTNYKELISNLLKKHNSRVHSYIGRGCDFKGVHYANPIQGGYSYVGGKTYKECYTNLCIRIAEYGRV